MKETMRNSLAAIVTILLYTATNASAKTYNILDFGALSSKRKSTAHINTRAIQAAIDAASATGDTVLIPKGVFETGTLFLKSNITILMEPLAWIYGSPDIEDYAEVPVATEEPHFSKCLFYVEGAENIKIVGDMRSEINGRGYFFKHAPLRPKLFRIEKSRNIEFQGIRIQNSGSWCVYFRECDSIRISEVCVYNHENRNNDGINFDGCSNVWVSDCNLQVGDDAICLKSSVDKVCENINVRDCTISSHTAAVKFGTASKTGFRNVKVSNCQFFNCRSGGVKLLAVDGAVLENVEISDIKMYNCGGPLFLRLGNRGRDYSESIRQIYGKDVKPEGRPVGKLRNIVFRNIEGRLVGRFDSTECIMFTGLPGHYIENVILENIHFSYSGHGNLDVKDRIVPEDEARYPEQSFFGILPSYGMYFRHVKGLQVKNVSMELRTHDSRPALIMNDVVESSFENIAFHIRPEAGSAMILNNSREIKLNNLNPSGEVEHLMNVKGGQSRQIDLVNTYVKGMDLKSIASFSDGASKNAVKVKH